MQAELSDLGWEAHNVVGLKFVIKDENAAVLSVTVDFCCVLRKSMACRTERLANIPARLGRRISQHHDSNHYILSEPYTESLHCVHFDCL